MMISTELFPYEKFEYRLEFGEKKNITVCWFECQEHLDKYLQRHKLDKRTVKINFRGKNTTNFSKENCKSEESKTKSNNKKSSNLSKEKTTSHNISEDTAKPKKRKRGN